MKIKNDLVKKISKDKGIDGRVIRLVVDSPIKFSRDRISDPEDMRPIRTRYFAVFTPKEKYEKVREQR